MGFAPLAPFILWLSGHVLRLLRASRFRHNVPHDGQRGACRLGSLDSLPAPWLSDSAEAAVALRAKFVRRSLLVAGHIQSVLERGVQHLLLENYVEHVVDWALRAARDGGGRGRADGVELRLSAPGALQMLEVAAADVPPLLAAGAEAGFPVFWCHLNRLGAGRVLED